MGLFSKKQCDICGGDIGLLGNRKLEDGNMCKNCAKLLSPWFSDRRRSTVDEIKAQLAYREDNKSKVAAFRTTRILGDRTKVLLDEDAGVFMVTAERDLTAANPDVIAFSDVTGCDLDIKESRSEVRHSGPDGRQVSYNPPRFTYRYDFNLYINVRNPYFDEIHIKLNNSSVTIDTHGFGTVGGRYLDRAIGFDPERSPEYCKYRDMGEEIRDTLLYARQNARSAFTASAPAPAAPQVRSDTPWNCPACNGMNNGGRFCVNCGAPRQL